MAQFLTTTWNSTTIKDGAIQKKIIYLMVSEKALLPHSQKYSRASRCQIGQYRGLQEGSPLQIFLLKKYLTLFALRLSALVEFLQRVRARLPKRRPLLARSNTFTAHAPLLRHCLDHPALVFQYESCLCPLVRLARASAVARNQRSSTLE